MGQPSFEIILEMSTLSLLFSTTEIRCYKGYLFCESVEIAIQALNKSKVSIRQSPLQDFMRQFHCVC